jgi:hypothetical protein
MREEKHCKSTVSCQISKENLIERFFNLHLGIDEPSTRFAYIMYNVPGGVIIHQFNVCLFYVACLQQ